MKWWVCIKLCRLSLLCATSWRRESTRILMHTHHFIPLGAAHCYCCYYLSLFVEDSCEWVGVSSSRCIHHAHLCSNVPFLWLCTSSTNFLFSLQENALSVKWSHHIILLHYLHIFSPSYWHQDHRFRQLKPLVHHFALWFFAHVLCLVVLRKKMSRAPVFRSTISTLP